MSRPARSPRGVPDAMKDAGVLVGVTGRYGNVVKIRPPLVFDHEHIDLVASALERALRELGASGASVASSP